MSGRMFRARSGVLQTTVSTPAFDFQKRCSSMGGRANSLGFSQPLGKSPQVKQGPAHGVARRIPGTTKIRYTNKKGRTFNFSIPVSEVMQAPATRQSATGSGWKAIDTSFCDTGELDEDMPSSVDELLRQAVRVSDSQEVIAMNAEELRALHRSFVDLCKEYALMDTRGMKTTLTYRERHSGPDYELYDRKLRRRRHWLTITHRMTDVRELLWPSAVLSATCPADLETLQPLLSAAEMLEALTWVEAASAFAIRTPRPYDTAERRDFAPIDLHREIAVLASTIRLAHADGGFFDGSPPLADAEERAPSVLLAARAQPDDEPWRQASVAVDRFVSCVSLCKTHNVSVSRLWASPGSGHAAPAEAGEHRAAWYCRQVLLNAPCAIHSVQQAVRVIHSIMAMVADESARAAGGSAAAVCFSDAGGKLTDPLLLRRIAALCPPTLFTDREALANVDADALALLLQFVVLVRDANGDFFATPRGGSRGGMNSSDDAEIAVMQQNFLAFSHALLERARSLLYRLDGPAATVVSGDEARVPLVELQAQAERTEPRALVHYNIGMRHAQGMRLATLQAHVSSRLLELVAQLEESTKNANSHRPLTTLSADLIQHIAHKVANGKNRLTVDDVVRVLPHIGAMTERGQNHAAMARFDRLLSSCAVTIGVELQHKQSALKLTQIAEGLASCGYRPSNIDVLHMALLRMFLSGAFPLSLVNRALRAVLQLVGAHEMPAALLNRTVTVCLRAANVPASLCTSEASVNACRELFGVVRTLYYCGYPSLPTLVLQLESTEVLRWLRSAAARDALPSALLLQYGVALTFAVVKLEPNDVETEQRLSETARTLLVKAWATPFHPETGDDWEVVVDSVMALAALGLTEAPAALSTLANEPPSSPHLWLHPLRTPSLGTSVLESLTELQLAETPLFAAYHKELEATVTSLHRSSTSAHRVAQGTSLPPASTLENAEFEFLLRLLSLRSVDADLSRRAGALVLREVEHLADVLSASEMNGGPLVTASSESANAARHARAAEIERAILRGYDALRNNDACASILRTRE